MPTTENSGTQAATLDTEHSLDTDTTAKVFVLSVDANAMADGDILILRIKTRVLTGGTNRIVYQSVFAHVQGEPIKISVPVVSMFNIEFTLEQTDGTGRSYPWSVVSL